MELTKFVKIIKNNIVFIIIVALIGALIGFFSADFFSSGYHHSQLFFLMSPPNQTASMQNNLSERYYLQEKSRNFTDTAVAILDSVDFKNEVLSPGDSLAVRKVAPQLIRLDFISPTPDSNNVQLNKVTREFNSKIQSLIESTPAAQLKPIASVASPVYSSLNSRVLFVFGAVLATAFALFVVGIKNYFKL